MINFATAFVVALGVMASTIKAEGEIQCDATVRKVGCFTNEYGYFPEKLINDRVKFDFKNVKASLNSLICRCAKKVAEKGYTHFTINAFTQCSSGPDAGDVWRTNGRSDSCLPASEKVIKCDDNDDVPCSGKERSNNYVYTIQKKPPCQDEWKEDYCQRYARKGFCKEEDMTLNCRKTCKLCHFFS